MTLRAVVVDDEDLARERVCDLVRGHAELTLVGEAGDGATALDRLSELRPDLVFLDIQMPEMGGFEVLAALAPDVRASVVFVTAYDEFAVQAFEVGAVDYLMKPVAPARFAAAVERILARETPAPMAAEARALARAWVAERGWVRRFVGRRNGRHYFIAVDSVEWIQADGNYLRVHADGEVHLVRGTMKWAETRLDPDQFVRIHRSAAVSVNHIASVAANGNGEYVVTLEGGRRLTSSRGYSDRLRRLLRPDPSSPA